METISTKLVVQLENKREIERLISILNLGICAALKKRIVDLEEAIDLIHLGTELEDVESLIPEKLSDSIREIEAGTLKFLQSLGSGSSTDKSRKKWIQNQTSYTIQSSKSGANP